MQSGLSSLAVTPHQSCHARVQIACLVPSRFEFLLLFSLMIRKTHVHETRQYSNCSMGNVTVTTTSVVRPVRPVETDLLCSHWIISVQPTTQVMLGRNDTNQPISLTHVALCPKRPGGNEVECTWNTGTREKNPGSIKSAKTIF